MAAQGRNLMNFSLAREAPARRERSLRNRKLRLTFKKHPAPCGYSCVARVPSARSPKLPNPSQISLELSQCAKFILTETKIEQYGAECEMPKQVKAEL